MNTVNSVKFGGFSVKFRHFWAKIRWNFNFLRVLVWYNNKYKRNYDFTFLEASELVDYTIMSWLLNLSFWMFKVSVSGIILWYVLFMLIAPNLPFFTFFALGLVNWIIVRLKPKWW